MRYLIAGLFSLLATVGAAEDENAKMYYTPDQIRISKVSIQDLAKDACWTNLTEVRQYLEEQFRIRGYELLNSQNADWITDEQRTLVDRTMRKLPDELPNEDRKAVFLNMIQDNVYDAFIRVTSNRSSFGDCFGSARIGLSRYVGGHTEDQSVYVEYTYLSQTLLERNNLNTELIELSKQFVSYIATGTYED